MNASSQITRTQNHIFDELSRLYQSVGGESQTSQFAYDANSNPVENREDPSDLDQTNGNAFDGLNRLITSINAIGGVSQYDYDQRSNVTSVSDQRGLTTNYIYDGFDNLILLDSPDSGVTVYTYDESGNLNSQVDARGIEKQFTYDALNRLTLEHYPADSSEDISYTYDQTTLTSYNTGRLTEILDQSGVTSYASDYRGNQISTTVTLQGNVYTTAFTYDLSGNLLQTIYPII